MGALKSKREALGYSQRELARRAGVAYKTVQLLESGGHNPRWSTLAKVAKALRETPGALVETAGSAARGDLAWTAARIAQGGEDSWRLRLFEFVDDFRRSPSFDLVAAAPPPGISHRLHSLLASTVESLCAERRVPVPWWCAGVPALREPWFVSGMESLKAIALAESPAAFRQRNIFVLANFLERA